MTTLLTEDLLLLTAHPTRGTIRRPTGSALPRALAGAAIIDLLAAQGAAPGGDRLLVAGVPPPAHPLLRHVAARLSGRHLTVDEAIESLAAPRARLGQHVLRSLVAEAAVRPRHRRLLGVLPLTSHELTAVDDVQRLRRRVADALRGPVDDPRAVALARLVVAADLARAVRTPAAPASAGHAWSLDAQEPVASAVARTVRRARRDAATTGAIAATAGGVVGSGS